MSLDASPLDGVVAQLHPIMRANGFKKRKQLFNRSTDGGLVHVVEIVGRGDRVTVRVGVFSPRLHRLVQPAAKDRVWVEAQQCHFLDALALRDPDDLEGRGYHPAFAGRVLAQKMESSVIPYLSTFTDLGDLVAVVPRESAWGEELETDSLIRLLAESGDVLRAQALIQREYQAGDPTRRVELRSLASALVGVTLAAAAEVATSESFLAEWSEAEVEHAEELAQLVALAPDAVISGRFPDVLGRPRTVVSPTGMLDGTRQSLEELWRWVLAVFPNVHKYTTEPQPVESRYRVPVSLTSGELWLAELLAVYLARILRRSSPGLRWVLDRSGHLALGERDRHVDLVDRTCLALDWVKRPPDSASHVPIDQVNQLEDVILYAEEQLR